MQQCSTKVLASYRLREQVSGAVRHRRNAASKSAGQLEKKLALIATADLPAKFFSRFPANSAVQSSVAAVVPQGDVDLDVDAVECTVAPNLITRRRWSLMTMPYLFIRCYHKLICLLSMHN